jgi:hypothetical protein
MVAQGARVPTVCMPAFNLVTELTPQGDEGEAIAALSNGASRSERE